MYTLRYLRLVAFLTVLLALPLYLPVGVSQGNSFATAELIQKGTYSFFLPQGADHYFKVQLATGERIYVTLESPAGSDYDLYLYGPSQAQVDSSISTTGFDWVGQAPSEVVGGFYYIKVHYWDGPGGTYELVVGPTRISSGTQTLTMPENGRAFFEINAQNGWALELSMTQPPQTDIDIRVFDPDGTFVDSSTKLAGEVEQISTTLTKSGPHLLRIEYFSGPGGSYQLTLVVGPKITVRILGLPSSLWASVSIAGNPVQDIAGGSTVDVILPDGVVATMSVTEDVQQTDQIRYHCYSASWAPSTSSHDFTYTLQHWLEINNGGHGTVSPASGWYDSGASVEVSVSQTTVQSGTDTKYVFQRWDGASTSSSDRVTLTMDSPKSITAVWKTQYYLKIISEHGTPTGEGWYDSGSNVQISVDESVGLIPVRYVFDRWDGSGVSTPTSHSTTVDMSTPRTVTAVWKEDYLPTIAAAGGGIVIIVVVAFFLLRRKPSAPSQPTYIPPPPPT